MYKRQIHRFEGGEHKNAVDGAVELLEKTPPANRPAVKVDPQVAQLMTSKITLGNGLKVMPGDLTAMMGDFYGVYNKDGSFNPQKSFENMNSPDNRAEMEVILAKIKKEEGTVQDALHDKGAFVASTPKELEKLTFKRHKKTDADGAVSGLSMLELAERNNAHFSAKDSKGTDNNMGAYESFHKMALEAARDGNENLARAYEASGMHFLTDRHAGGHQFEKAGVHNAYKEGGAISPLLQTTSPVVALYSAIRNGDTFSQGATHIVHNRFNKEGINVSNESGDKPWLAKGDNHWADHDNEENRYQTAKSVYTSYSELNSAFNGKSPEEIEKEGYAARKTVPKFDDQNQKNAEDMARNISGAEVISEEKENLNLIGPLAQRKWVNAKNWVGDKWQGAKDLGGRAVDWGKEKWQGAKDLGGQAVDWLGDKWQGAKDLGGRAVDWGKDKLQGAKEWAGDKWQGAKDLGGQAVDWGKEKWQGAKELGGQAADWGKGKWQGAKELGGQAVDWGKDKLQGAKELGGQAVDWGKKKASNAWEGAKDVASQGKEAASSGWGWLKKKVGF